ncbi:Carboxylic acid transporter [Sphaceloma murrayae]|uniref:Nitrate/nitrite transporter n=1 Tax=Sphaceloma murrayae TaxID=2082308 RepID=A0A2K1R263_9PEZI|nr:Carboxylic acid transporter [Sphaceloma murrayae]
MALASLWFAPEVNPINQKAKTIPIFNPLNQYGRVFFFSWLSFLLAFWSWYAFPPLLSDVIAGDIRVSRNVVSNSNVIALTATLLVRLIAGPSCDRFGPRLTFAGCLLLGAIPTFLAGTIKSAAGLYAIRFFVGILGGSFVPCQVWTTGFFDKNIVGTANSLTAGLGNAGGGITYFVMPAIYNSLRTQRGLSPSVAWRVSFVVPGIIITTAAIALILLCPDTPTGRWSDRFIATENNLRTHSVDGTVVDVPGHLGQTPATARSQSSSDLGDEEKKIDKTHTPAGFAEGDAHMISHDMVDTTRGEVIQKPSWSGMIRVIFSGPTLVTGACYFCTFGAELSINSILGTYYQRSLRLGLQDAGNLAAIFGLLNVIMRPLGGVASDYIYRRTGSVWSKKILLHSYCVMTGLFCVIIGVTNPKKEAALVGLISGGLAFFLEGANGLNYSLVPHVHSHANGIVSGFTGACGNLGGIVFAIIFRYNGTNYPKVFYIIGAIIIGLQVLTCWIRPVPKGQMAGK